MAPNHASMLVRVAAKRWEGYVQAGLLSREIREFGVPTRWIFVEGNIAGGGMRESPVDPARSKNQGMCGVFMRENRDIRYPMFVRAADHGVDRSGNAEAARLRCTSMGSQTAP